MDPRIYKRYILLFAFIIALAAIYSGGLVVAASYQDPASKVAVDSSRMHKKSGQQTVEQSPFYKTLSLENRFDFSVEATGRSEFELKFENPYKFPVKIRIYDIIGNLIAEEEAQAGVSFAKKYNFQSEKTRLFVVEVGNQKHNLTKKVTTI